ncbi:ATP-dependent RNA helicase chl1 [Achaetomium macrosporum]|uniref:ATP-dependent DNA helicase CHL1 n=1 Tax=Achaetomium macrosporum TaxID=79813 RepID=A0AAN7C5D4_9PEZI|nr:ATP-dependent RNA helicase chl1 [Achaetomium macrosporum]
MSENAAIDFHHPYQPYDVQLEFMRTVYDVLEKGYGQVGILESPTGTGKSLSLICATLTWLRSHKRSKFEASFNATAAGMAGEPEWMVEAALKRKREELGRRWEERERALERARMRERELEARGRERSAKRARVDDDGRRTKGGREVDEEREFLIEDWDGGDDTGDGLGPLSKETRELLEKVGLGGSREKEKIDGEVEDEIKIYYTSRTHSQLTQFISELRRPAFPPSIPTDVMSPKGGDEEKRATEAVKQLPLSSRQKLCINPSVARLGSLSAINDRCTELQQSKSKEKCPFLPNAENLKQTHEFRDTALATLPDIEDLHRVGKELQVCPYYASRTAIPGAEVITLPYPLLLQKSARDALGIKLEGNIVVIDEAHNIMDAVANVHAAEIRLSELRRARQMLGFYVKRFGKKLKGENRVMVAQVGKVIESLSECLSGLLTAKGDQGILDSSIILKARGADQINPYQLIKYIQESKLAYKVESYVSHAEEQEASSSGTVDKPTRSTPVLHILVSFMAALTNLSVEGRIFYEKLAVTPPDIKLSYLLLSPTHAFSSIASAARAIVLAGGTMSPFEDYKMHLFPTLPPDKITTLSCGHVIPSSNLFAWALASTKPVPPDNNNTAAADSFEFSFQKRSDRSMIRQLGLALLNICSVVPDGVVVFFPSYGYLDEVVTAWQTSDTPGQPPLWGRLAAKKALFRETKSGGPTSEELLQQYSAAILSPTSPSASAAPSSRGGAVLLSVVGGRLSEGINFSDRLGRCVVVVGLPYPNIHSPDWKARLEYIESTVLSRLSSEENQQQNNAAQARAQAKQAAREFYENACMRAVNQSIGRAIRHREDYAAVVLVDRRFGTERIKGKLPGWIRAGIVERAEEKGLQGLMGGLSLFFKGRRA